MAASKGNNFNKKWKTQGERTDAFDSICEHLASGLSKESYPHCDWDTVERYCREYPEDFPAEKLREAMRYQRLYWERQGLEGMAGLIPGFNATAWIFNMKNRFKEDWSDVRKTELTGSLQVENRQVIDPALLTHEQLEVIKQIGRQALLPPPVEGEWDDVGDGG